MMSIPHNLPHTPNLVALRRAAAAIVALAMPFVVAWLMGATLTSAHPDNPHPDAWITIPEQNAATDGQLKIVVRFADIPYAAGQGVNAELLVRIKPHGGVWGRFVQASGHCPVDLVNPTCIVQVPLASLLDASALRAGGGKLGWAMRPASVSGPPVWSSSWAFRYESSSLRLIVRPVPDTEPPTYASTTPSPAMGRSSVDRVTHVLCATAATAYGAGIGSIAGGVVGATVGTLVGLVGGPGGAIAGFSSGAVAGATAGAALGASGGYLVGEQLCR